VYFYRDRWPLVLIRGGHGRRWRRRLLRFLAVDLAAEVTNHIRRTLIESSAGWGLEQCVYFSFDVAAICRQSLRHIHRLERENPPEGEDQHEGEANDGQHCQQVRNGNPPQPANRRRKRKAQEHRQRQRDENVVAEVDAATMITMIASVTKA
jgi:hypothetical protein